MCPLISILVPVYNTEKYLNRCIDSILNQTYSNIEIILVNDGSKDNSARICADYQAKESRVKFISQPNGGVAEARNRCLENATGDYILFVDSDDFIEPNMVKVLYDTIIKTKCDISVSGSDNQTEYLLHSDQSFSFESISGPTIIKEFLEHRRLRGMLWNKLIRSTLFEGLQFNTTVGYGEDALIMYHLLKKTNSICYVNMTLYHYVLNNDSISYQSFNANKLTAIKVWDEICADVKINYPNLFHLAQQRRLAEMTILFVDASRSNYTIDCHVKYIMSTLRHNLMRIFLSRLISYRLKLFLIVGLWNYRLTKFYLR